MAKWWLLCKPPRAHSLPQTPTHTGLAQVGLTHALSLGVRSRQATPPCPYVGYTCKSMRRDGKRVNIGLGGRKRRRTKEGKERELLVNVCGKTAQKFSVSPHCNSTSVGAIGNSNNHFKKANYMTERWKTAPSRVWSWEKKIGPTRCSGSGSLDPGSSLAHNWFWPLQKCSRL